MAKFILSCCSTADLSKEHFDKIDVKYICFHYELDGVEHPDDLGQTMPFEEFYRKMTEGAATKTSQVNSDEYYDFWKPYLEQGYDILHLTLSSGISGSINSANIAREDLEEEFPDRKLYVVDSLGASSGYGLIMDESGGRVHSVSQVKEGEKLNLYVSDGKITVQVQKIEQTDRE